MREPTSPPRTLAVLLVVLAAACPALLAGSPAPVGATEGRYRAEAVTFLSEGLKIHAVLARPATDGTFPAYIYTHGSMTAEVAGGPPWTRLAAGSHLETLAREGYVVLLVARRGYRGSEGTTQSYTFRRLSGTIPRAADVFRSIQAESTDLLAAFQYLLTLPYVDKERIGLGGHSIGGLASVLAAALEPRLRALVVYAGGFKWTEGGVETSWSFVDEAWRESAKTITAPVLILWSKNDFSLEPDVGRQLEKALKKAGRPVEFILYPPFRENGHFLFTQQEGVATFTPDLLRFLYSTLRGTTR